MVTNVVLITICFITHWVIKQMNVKVIRSTLMKIFKKTMNYSGEGINNKIKNIKRFGYGIETLEIYAVEPLFCLA